MMELLCPAGDMTALFAAIKNGADAVYLGAEALNARRGAGNFSPDELIRAADYCHERGKKIYVTVNTIVKQSELGVLYGIAEQLYRAGADAAIVQDIGAASAFKKIVPELELHASTQMAIHNRYGVRFVKQLGMKRVVLARELSFGEIAECAKEGLQLEVFAHGALCVSCSGQCLFSSLVGGRSGNRGMCAQPCRLPYELHAPGYTRKGYMLSPKDLVQLGRLGQLERAGVSSIKIEGRLKRPEYVAIVAGYYRRMLDNPHEPERAEVDALKQIFNRGGFTRGYGPGLIDSELMSYEKPNHAGLVIGEVLSSGRVRLDQDVSAKDSLIVGDAPLKLSGAAGETVYCQQARNAPGPVFRLADDEQLKAARQTYEGMEAQSVPISGALHINTGAPARLTVSDGAVEVTVEGGVIAQAQNAASDPGRVRAQIMKTGGTPYRFDSLELELDPWAFAPAALLNELRRSALMELGAARIARLRPELNLVDGYEPARVKPVDIPGRPLLRAQIDDEALIAVALESGADGVEFRPRDFSADALSSINLRAPVYLALPMVCTDGDIDRLRDWAWSARDNISGVIIANVAQLAFDWPGKLEADYSLHAASDETIAYLTENCGIARYTPSLELTSREIDALGGEKALVVHGKLPLMQLRHCPLNAQRGGVKHESCRACDARGEIDHSYLIDRKGARFNLRRYRCSFGCVVQVLNSVPLGMIKHIGRLPKASVWRLIFSGEAPGEMGFLIEQYKIAAMGGNLQQSEAWPRIKDMELTGGHYQRGVE